MSKRSFKFLSIFSLIIIYMLTYKFYIYVELKAYAEYITAAVISLIAYCAYLLYGFQKDKPSELKKSVISIEIIILLAFFSIYYASGLFLGFLKSSYAFNIQNIISNLLSLIITFISIEIFRYIMVSAYRENKSARFLITLLICSLEIVLIVTGKNINKFDEVFELFSQEIIPIFAMNYTLTYLAKYVGLKPLLIFRLIFGLYTYILPIVPDIGNYLTSVIKIGIPMLLFIFSYRAIDDAINGVEYDFEKNMLKKSDIPIIIFLVFMACLISGKFPLYLIGIGSNSMAPTIYKGDAVLINKSNKNIKKGDIVAYKSNGKVIIHRVVKIKKKKNSKQYYYTVKGDANNTPDSLELTKNDVVGVVLFKMKYIGYPSVLLSEKFNN